MHFFDGITALSQVIIFFLIGFLSFPHKIPEILLPAILITAFLTFIARPLAVSLIMLPFKATWNQIFFISSAGLRGAASIVFAILVVAESEALVYDLFHIVFVVALLSVTLQGSLLPFLAKKSGMIDRFYDVRKTFNDYQQEAAISLNKLTIEENHPWNNSMLKDIKISKNALILTVTRDGEKIIPNGQTKLQVNDEILLGQTYEKTPEDIKLTETNIDEGHYWLDKKVCEIEFPHNFLIALIKRNDEYIVPHGNTEIKLNDTIVFYEA